MISMGRRKRTAFNTMKRTNPSPGDWEGRDVAVAILAGGRSLLASLAIIDGNSDWILSWSSDRRK